MEGVSAKMNAIDPTLEIVVRDVAFFFGYHVRNPDAALRVYRRGRITEARRVLRAVLRQRPELRGLIRDAVNAGLRAE